LDKSEGVPDSVTLFTQMSQAVHELLSRPGIPATVRGVRDGGGGSAHDPEDSQTESGIESYQGTILWALEKVPVGPSSSSARRVISAAPSGMVCGPRC
jgi:hypothetical protein